MIDGCEWNGAPIPTESEIRISELDRKYEVQIEYVCKQIGIKTPKEIKHEQWEKDNFFDKETQTTRKMRLEAIKKYGEPICYNINSEAVYIDNCPDAKEYMKEHGIEIEE